MLRMSLADLSQLLERDAEACVTIYLSRPTVEGFRGHYRALVKRAEGMLGSNARLQTKSRLLSSLRAFGAFVMEKDASLPAGLAFFASPSFIGWFPMPTRTRGAVFVSNSFHIRPLLPYLNPSMRWYALQMGETGSSLYRCASDADELIAHCSTGAQRIRAKCASAEKLERWVCDRLAMGHRAPLIVTAPNDVQSEVLGVEALSSFPTPFVGHEDLPRDVGHAPTLLWPLAKQHLLSHSRQVVVDLRREYVKGRAATRPEEVVKRLRDGRLRAIAVCEEGQMRGRVDWRTGDLQFLESSSDFGDCVIDDLVERALRERCRVVQAQGADLPPGALLLAV